MEDKMADREYKLAVPLGLWILVTVLLLVYIIVSWMQYNQHTEAARNIVGKGLPDHVVSSFQDTDTRHSEKIGGIERDLILVQSELGKIKNIKAELDAGLDEKFDTVTNAMATEVAQVEQRITQAQHNLNQQVQQVANPAITSRTFQDNNSKHVTNPNITLQSIANTQPSIAYETEIHDKPSKMEVLRQYIIANSPELLKKSDLDAQDSVDTIIDETLANATPEELTQPPVLQEDRTTDSYQQSLFSSKLGELRELFTSIQGRVENIEANMEELMAYSHPPKGWNSR